MQSFSQNVPTNKPTSSCFTDRMPFLSPSQQCPSTEGYCIWILEMEMVDKSCYLGDVLDAGGGCDSAVTAGICLEKVLYSNWKRVN